MEAPCQTWHLRREVSPSIDCCGRQEFSDMSLLLKQYRNPASQLGSLGVVSLGIGSVISPASTASERVTLEPIISPEDTALVAEMDATIPELFLKSLAGSTKRALSVASWTSRKRTLTGLLGCTTSEVGNVVRYRKTRE